MNYTVLMPQPWVSFVDLRNEGTKLIKKPVVWWGHQV